MLEHLKILYSTGTNFINLLVLKVLSLVLINYLSDLT